MTPFLAILDAEKLEVSKRNRIPLLVPCRSFLIEFFLKMPIVLTNYLLASKVGNLLIYILTSSWYALNKILSIVTSLVAMRVVFVLGRHGLFKS